jgi:hypothetical protein
MGLPFTIGQDGSEFVGKSLLVGVRWTSQGEVVREEQFHGRILEADSEGLVVERADTGARVILPPELQEAPEGDYKLRATGEVVHNPDFFATWRFDQDEMPRLPEMPRKVN